MRRWWRLGLGVTLLGLLAFLGPLIMPDYFVRVLTVMALNVVLVSSLGLSNGFTGVFSLCRSSSAYRARRRRVE